MAPRLQTWESYDSNGIWDGVLDAGVSSGGNAKESSEGSG